MKRRYLFELCVETLDAVLVAQTCSVGRVELCANLRVGGVTPALSLVKAAVQAVSLPIHVLVRPREGNFVFSKAEYAQMERDIIAIKKAGAAGVVLGALDSEGRIDVAGTCRLIELARPMKVTFHRAFDEAFDQFDALEQVISTGADYLLTSGGAPNVLAGADRIAELKRRAGNRIAIMVGGGLTLDSLAEVAERTGVTNFHASLRRANIASSNGKASGGEYPCDILCQDVVESIHRLEDAFSVPQ